MKHALTWMLAGVVGLILGYCIGGWVYEVAGDHVWRVAILEVDWKEWQPLVAGVFGLVGGTLAAGGAWLAVSHQLKVEGRRRAEEKVAGDINVLLTLEAELGFASIALHNDPGTESRARIQTVRELWLRAMAVDPWLGSILGQCLSEWEQFRQVNNPRGETTATFAYQLSMLAKAMGTCASALLEGRTIQDPILSQRDFDRVLPRYPAATAPLTFAERLKRKPPGTSS